MFRQGLTYLNARLRPRQGVPRETKRCSPEPRGKRRLVILAPGKGVGSQFDAEQMPTLYLDKAGVATLAGDGEFEGIASPQARPAPAAPGDRKSTRLNSSHVRTSYAV